MAADEPGLYVRETVAVAGQPGGLISDTVVEARSPVMRYGGAVFNMTYAGAGARYAVTPAFTDMAVRVSLAPIDVFDVTFEGVRSLYFNNAFGMMTFNDLSDTTGAFRADRFKLGHAFGGSAWSFVATPTGKIKVGPVVGLSSWTLTWIKIKEPASNQGPTGTNDPWVWEPFRGMVVGWNDLLLEYTQALLIQLEPKGNLIRFGGVYRGRASKVSPDLTITAGALVQVDPKGGAGIPSTTLIVSPYLRDPDYADDGIPFVAGVLTWEGDVAFKKGSPIPEEME